MRKKKTSCKNNNYTDRKQNFVQNVNGNTLVCDIDFGIFGLDANRHFYFDVHFVHSLPPSTPIGVTGYNTTSFFKEIGSHVTKMIVEYCNRVTIVYYSAHFTCNVPYRTQASQGKNKSRMS